MSGPEDLEARERRLEERERELERREKALEGKPFSQAVQRKKEQWYDKVTLSVRQMNVIIGIVSALLGITVVLIILEAAGVFSIWG
ncbi:MAG: hypothetical protein IKH38_02165 [Clostridia bacterium]|nr:hypothetical protein [Clostridia bacterium]